MTMPHNSCAAFRCLAVAACLLSATLLQAQDAGSPPAAARRLSGELRELFANASDAFVLDGQAVPQKRDRAVLTAHLAFAQSWQCRLASMALGLEQFAGALATNTLRAEPGSTLAMFQGVVLARLANAFRGERESLSPVVVELTGDGGTIASTYESLAAGMTLQICSAVALADRQAAMQELQATLPPAPAPLPADSIAMSFEERGKDVVLALTNTGKTTLTDCVLDCHYRPDLAKVMAILARKSTGGAAERRARRLANAQAGLDSLDRGSLVYVPEWRPGSDLEVALASVAAIVAAPGTARLSIWSDAGAQLDRAVAVDEARRMLGDRPAESEPTPSETESAELEPDAPRAPMPIKPPTPAPPSRPAPAVPPAAPPPPVEFDTALPQVKELLAATTDLELGQFALARTGFEAVKVALARTPADATTKRLLAVARYRLGECLRRIAVQKAKEARDDADAERLYRAADREFAALTGDDFATTREGSSLKAAALRARILVNGILFDGYRELAAASPKTKVYRQKRDEFRAAANKLFDELKTSFAEATLPDGRRIVDVARQEAAALAR